MKLEIKKHQFNDWLKKSNLSKETDHHIVVEKYFNEVLIQGVYNAVISSISSLEQSDAYENGVLVSELLENEVTAFLYAATGD